MEKERFSLKAGANLMWTVSDTENGINIKFREGLFNETQRVNVSDEWSGIDAIKKLASLLREIGDWLAENHSEVALCDWEARRSAIWKLSNEKYWLAMAAATNSLLITEGDTCYSFMLYSEVCDWLEIERRVDLTKAEEENLKGVLSGLTDSEAWEVLKILHVFWSYRTDDCDMFQWAMDVTWWPVWLPDELKMQGVCEDDDIIDED